MAGTDNSPEVVDGTIAGNWTEPEVAPCDPGQKDWKEFLADQLNGGKPQGNYEPMMCYDKFSMARIFNPTKYMDKDE